MKNIINKIALIFKKDQANPRPLFVTVLREYITKQNVENCLSVGTSKKYEGFYSNICMFLSSVKMKDCTVDRLKPKTMEDLKFWLHKNLHTCSATHSARHIELCKRVVKYAVRMEYVANNPLDGVETKRDRIKDVVCLERSELLRLIGYKFENEIYRLVADLYVFQSFTGLSYADLYTFTVIEDSGRRWIFNRRTKNDTPYWVPLFAEASKVLDKYDGKMPLIANQTYNRVLKEISRVIGFKKHLTTHTARKTFATQMHNEGWNSKLISIMLGQKSVEVFENHYLKVDRKAIENEMKRLDVA